MKALLVSIKCNSKNESKSQLIPPSGGRGQRWYQSNVIHERKQITMRYCSFSASIVPNNTERSVSFAFPFPYIGHMPANGRIFRYWHRQNSRFRQGTLLSRLYPNGVSGPDAIIRIPFAILECRLWSVCIHCAW